MSEVMTICITIKCVEIMVIVFISSCHKELITSRKKGRNMVTGPEFLCSQDASCAFSRLRPSIKGWTQEFHNCCRLNQILSWLLPALLLSSSHPQAHFHCWIRLLNQSFSKLSSCSIPFWSSAFAS
jgi:hypothetical protein